MSVLSQFQNGDRVCFIGDSITVRSYWIACIAQHYAENIKKKVDFFPCGVGGGTTIAAISYMQQQTIIYNPNVAVIMLGMNDINHGAYEGEITEEKLKAREEALDDYKNNLMVLSNQLKDLTDVKRVIYLSPTPYDEEQKCETLCRKGASVALRKAADIVKQVAEKFDGEFYDIGGDMLELLKKIHIKKGTNELITVDRVHPNEMGFSVMARLFLSAQGFNDIACATEDTICDGTAIYKLSEKAELFRKAAYDVQWLWTIEWTAIRKAPDKTQNGKFIYADNYIMYKPNADDYFKQLASDYRNFKSSESKLVEEIITANNRLYEEN